MFNWLDHNLWVVPAILFALGVRDVIRAVKQWKTGSWWWGQDEKGVAKRIYSDERVNLWTIPAMVHAYILVAAAIVIGLAMLGEK